jgi:hypothetical protein
MTLKWLQKAQTGRMEGDFFHDEREICRTEGRDREVCIVNPVYLW